MTNTTQHRRWMGIRRRAANGKLALVILLLSAAVTTRSAQAQTFTVLYKFVGAPDGSYPLAGLIRDGAGNLYGTTYWGGNLACGDGYGCGTVFKLDATGKETVLYSFGGRGGKYPVAGLIRDAAGNIYGTASGGGAFHQGTVFRLNAAGKFKVLHSFAGMDGATPHADLIRDGAGNLYGTTRDGGSFLQGTVFKLDATGEETVLHSFAGGADGAGPTAGLIRDGAGNLYGTTPYGGFVAGGVFTGGGFGGPAFGGTVFRVDATGTETVLYRFPGGAHGAIPIASLIGDAAGNLYGATTYGGDLACNFGDGCGTVFKLDGTGIETVLYSFAGGADGAGPTAGLVRDAQGNLYGTTEGGGAHFWGTIFRLDATGLKTVLYDFRGDDDGALPEGGLIRDGAGNLYGTTKAYGNRPCICGTVFKIAP